MAANGPETLGALLEVAAATPATGLRFVDRQEHATFHTWQALRDTALGICGGLRALGIEPGERVALVFPTGPDFFHAFFGIVLAGAVPVPLYPPVRLGRLDEYHQRTAQMLRAAGCRLLLADRRVRALLGKTVEGASLVLGCRTLSSLPAGPENPLDRQPDDLALVQFSSGTTVDPKPVALSHRALLAQTRALDDQWRQPPNSGPSIGDQPTGVSWLPLYHDMGLIGCVFPALELPSVLTLIGPEIFVRRPALWLRTLSRYRAEISVAPNFAFGLCVERVRDDELEGVDLSRWRLALNGAEPVAPSVLRAFRDRFAPWGFREEALTPVYGLSEAALAVTFSEFDQPFRSFHYDCQLLGEHGRAVRIPTAQATADTSIEIASVGRPLTGFGLRIVGPGGQALPERRVGRVWASGPSLMDGYLDRPDATARALVDGWLDTGDLGFLDDGALYLTGRAKDVLILRGRNHPPTVVEQPLDDVEGVRRGCAVAVSWRAPGDDATERLLVFVEHAQDAGAALIADLGQRCVEASLGASNLRPDAVFVLEPGTLPRTSSGKLRRRATLEQHLAGTLSAPDAMTTLQWARSLAGSAVGFVRAARYQGGGQRGEG